MQLSQRHVSSAPTSPPHSGGMPVHQQWYAASPPPSHNTPPSSTNNLFQAPYGQEHNIQIVQQQQIGGTYSPISPPTSQGRPGSRSSGAFQPASHTAQGQTSILDPSQPPAARRSPGGNGTPAAFGHNELFSTVAQVAENPFARMMFQHAGQWGAEAQAKGLEGITKYLQATNLKYYFDINNSYVPNKLKVILFPILHKSWKRRIVRTQEGQDAYPPPKEDLNAPDLYIPVMAFVTYVLVVSFLLGVKNEFHPEVLGKVASTGLISLCFEVLFLKFGFYLLNSINSSIMDLVSYSGYIFVGLVFNHLVAMFLGRYAYYCAMLVNGVFMAIFMVRTLRLLVLPDQEAVANSPFPSNRRNYFLLSVAVLQLIMSYGLGLY